MISLKTEWNILTLLVTFALPVSPVLAVSIETVLVGNPHNAPDHDYFAPGNVLQQGPNDGGRGSVAYNYEIGKYLVTNAQYAEFLNAVASEDAHLLYNTAMNSAIYGGITRSGTSGNYSYTLKPNMAHKPITQVNFWDAARFTNWLHNGQPTGAQDDTTTEDGVYTLGGVTVPDNLSVFRNVGAKWFLPNEDEWYKAAFHQPASQGGDSDDYWMFPTASNVQPITATADSVGNISNPGSNVASYQGTANWNGSTNGNLTTVGSAGPLSESYYGTADMAGNAWDWLETIVYTSVNVRDEDGRRVWGAGHDNNPTNFRADHNVHHFVATEDRRNLGFRVARYAQEALFAGDFDLDDDVDENDLTDPTLGWSARYGIDLDGSDFLNWQRQFGSSDVPQTSSATVVPEPSSSLLLIGLVTVAGRFLYRDIGGLG
ncbi:formylglycine-generating enzyme family protein [Bythopirellula goksoeyrii]|uniref:Formylglycine-generating sulfatase enzyme n=1 Tax=Bythopirellula goksoeyrii TaxID=1400387 RepID=A0A5B9QCN4_9BACT|nr:SUMF1/EgtB/PvdO family nonheme iron enzyme [Bythopirellula goksoeyrii]QEG34706.1 Formylglycine-generating sulfatase enzyme [Bythopirellula goksoeyrii]